MPLETTILNVNTAPVAALLHHFVRAVSPASTRSILGYRISPLDQLGQHRNDPFQVGLASHMPLGIDRIE
jgi:hypothetical protein